MRGVPNAPLDLPYSKPAGTSSSDSLSGMNVIRHGFGGAHGIIPAISDGNIFHSSGDHRLQVLTTTVCPGKDDNVRVTSTYSATIPATRFPLGRISNFGQRSYRLRSLQAKTQTMTGTAENEEGDAKFTWVSLQIVLCLLRLTMSAQTGTKLSKDASFFGAKKAVHWIPPVGYVRNLYFLECDDVIF
ncbi:hypothetical protein BU26DRAFT_608015 [Trematosphaeria pertusa]|uniref:Uncharacterized protein n=1 Tax=Trematosphaeria pertusa TaxID=390896 RepID=A0A6A6I435_9PLEO|nr:uncharacterized protein BU26DRAFT_608015 [Trematosphaeria pertusa]KAF2245111.1 hypothetical protein BU26DRAFT_608015 [Trematosphaeria pertusa]